MTEKEPLLVVKYVWWRVLLRNILLIIGALIIYSVYKMLLRDGNLLWIFFLFLLIVGLIMIIMNFLSRNIIFYQDRVEKRWLTIGSYTIYYLDSSLKITQIPLFSIFIFFRKSSSRFKKINIQLEFFQKSDQKKIIKIIEKISNKTFVELKEDTYWSFKKIKGV